MGKNNAIGRIYAFSSTNRRKQDIFYTSRKLRKKDSRNLWNGQVCLSSTTTAALLIAYLFTASVFAPPIEPPKLLPGKKEKDKHRTLELSSANGKPLANRRRSSRQNTATSLNPSSPTQPSNKSSDDKMRGLKITFYNYAGMFLEANVVLTKYYRLSRILDRLYGHQC